MWEVCKKKGSGRTGRMNMTTAMIVYPTEGRNEKCGDVAKRVRLWYFAVISGMRERANATCF